MRVRRLWMVTGSDTQPGLHSRISRCIQFPCDVGNEDDLRSWKSDGCRDLVIAGLFIFRPSRCVEVSTEKSSQIACSSAGKQQALCQDASRRKDMNRNSRGLPARKRRWYIFEDFSM